MSEFDKKPEIPDFITLPETVQEPGIIHSIEVEETGFLYFTDEINHTVVSLDFPGRLRWCLGGKGSEPGKFHYPRGFALGRVQLDIGKQRCLAVSDSWNNRIQLLDLDGSPLSIWTHAGGIPFREPSDIRFVEGAWGSGNHGPCWLVLDRGNHRLCALDESGTMLFQIGRGLPPKLRKNWAEQQFLFPESAIADRFIPEYEQYDGLFYPTRILGISSKCISLCEPGSSNLMLAIDRNIFPIPLGTFPDGEWIAADERSAVEWSLSNSRLRWYGTDGKLLGEKSISGRPVPSNPSSEHIWAQKGRKLSLVVPPWKAEDSCSPSGVENLLLFAADRFTRSFNLDRTYESAELLFDLAREVSAFVNCVAHGADSSSTFEADTQGARKMPADLEIRYQKAQQSIAAPIHPFGMAGLAFRLAAISGIDISGNIPFSEWCVAVQSIAAKVYKGFLEIVMAYDDIEFCLANPKAIAEQSPQIELLEQLRNVLRGSGSQLSHWCNSINLYNQNRFVDSQASTLVNSSSPFVSSTRISSSGGKHVLSETDQFRYDVSPVSTLALPLYMTRAPEGGFFVSFHISGHIAEIAGNGRLIRILGAPNMPIGFDRPAGLAVDEKCRLWVAESAAGKIQILEPPYNNPGVFLDSEREGVIFRWPVGLCSAPNAVFVTDPQRNQVVRIGADGQWDVILNRAGRNLGEIRCPNSLFFDHAAAPALWIVDKLNHRVQKFAADWHAAVQVGKCGVGKGELLYPLALGIFSDGTLVVSQEGPPPALKIFNASGEEIDCLLLDYSPVGILIDDTRIWVVGSSDNSIRLYERNR
jgi:hypothetical protein